MANKTELVFIIDKSGSMSGLEQDTIGGFNSLVEKQKNEEGEVLVSTVLFSTENEVIHNRVPIDKVEKMTSKDYTPGGCTALLDAMGGAINHITRVHNEMPKEEVPSKTLFVITTDGMENSSREYSYNVVKNLIENSKARGFEYIFLGANIDAVEEASRFGIEKDFAVNYHSDKEGTELNYECLNEAVYSMRKCGTVGKNWRKNIDADFASRK